MAMGFLKSIFIICALTIVIANGNNLKISLYYECLCPDSIRFVTRQLYPTYKLLGDDIDVDLVAYGFASATNASGKWEFECQHGPRECYANKVQSCVVAQNAVPDAVEFLYCAMMSGHVWDDTYLQKCATESQIKWNEVVDCINSGQGDTLLVANGKKTNAVNPKIQFIPTIVFNDHFNQTFQDDSLNNLKDVVCNLLDYEPSSCENEFDNIIATLI